MSQKQSFILEENFTKADFFDRIKYDSNYDWIRFDKQFPLGTSKENRMRRTNLFKMFDNDKDMQLSLSEVQNGLIKQMYIKDLQQCNYVIKKAFKDTFEQRKYVRKHENIERTEFRLFLKYVYIYFYIWHGIFQWFERDGDQRITKKNFVKSADLLNKAGIIVKDSSATYKYIDISRGGQLLWTEVAQFIYDALPEDLVTLKDEEYQTEMEDYDEEDEQNNNNNQSQEYNPGDLVVVPQASGKKQYKKVKIDENMRERDVSNSENEVSKFKKSSLKRPQKTQNFQQERGNMQQQKQQQQQQQQQVDSHYEEGDREVSPYNFVQKRMYFISGAKTALAPVSFKNKEIQTDPDPNKEQEALAFIVIRQQIEQQIIEVEKIQDKHKALLEKYEAIKIESFQPVFKNNTVHTQGNEEEEEPQQYELKLEDLENFVREFQQFQEGYRSQKLLYKRTSENYFKNNNPPKGNKNKKYREDYLKETLLSEEQKEIQNKQLLKEFECLKEQYHNLILGWMKGYEKLKNSYQKESQKVQKNSQDYQGSYLKLEKDVEKLIVMINTKCVDVNLSDVIPHGNAENNNESAMETLEKVSVEVIRYYQEEKQKKIHEKQQLLQQIRELKREKEEQKDGFESQIEKLKEQLKNQQEKMDKIQKSKDVDLQEIKDLQDVKVIQNHQIETLQKDAAVQEQFYNDLTKKLEEKEGELQAIENIKKESKDKDCNTDPIEHVYEEKIRHLKYDIKDMERTIEKNTLLYNNDIETKGILVKNLQTQVASLMQYQTESQQVQQEQDEELKTLRKENQFHETQNIKLQSEREMILKKEKQLSQFESQIYTQQQKIKEQYGEIFDKDKVITEQQLTIDNFKTQVAKKQELFKSSISVLKQQLDTMKREIVVMIKEAQNKNDEFLREKLRDILFKLYIQNKREEKVKVQQEENTKILQDQVEFLQGNLDVVSKKEKTAVNQILYQNTLLHHQQVDLRNAHMQILEAQQQIQELHPITHQPRIEKRPKRGTRPVSSAGKIDQQRVQRSMSLSENKKRTSKNPQGMPNLSEQFYSTVQPAKYQVKRDSIDKTYRRNLYEKFDWNYFNDILPLELTMEHYKKRNQLFQRFDNGNGYLSLSEVQNGMQRVLKLEELFKALPVIQLAFKYTKQIGLAANNNKVVQSDFIERHEFRQLLVFVKKFFESWVLFNQIDLNGDRRIKCSSFKQQVPLMKKQGIQFQLDIEDDIRELDYNGGGMILFDEFCVWVLNQDKKILEDICSDTYQNNQGNDVSQQQLQNGNGKGGPIPSPQSSFEKATVNVMNNNQNSMVSSLQSTQTKKFQYNKKQYSNNFMENPEITSNNSPLKNERMQFAGQQLDNFHPQQVNYRENELTPKIRQQQQQYNGNYRTRQNN